MKVSVITVVHNGEAFLEDCIKSVLNQDYTELEYIIVDGGSTDKTISIINKYKHLINCVVSEKDNGLYDAINKGINLATGELIGILNADDIFAASDTIRRIAVGFAGKLSVDAVYGDLNYVHPTKMKIVRRWKSKTADYRAIEKGWMPAHPTLYLRRAVFEKYGNYALDMGTAADYDLILRFFHVHKIVTRYLPILMVNMRTGGVSNQSLKSLFYALKYDYRALKRNKIPNPLTVLFRKKFAKLSQLR